MLPHDRVKVAIPAERNPSLIQAALNRLKREGKSLSCTDYGGCYKGAWILGGVVLKRTSLVNAWAELYPQFYSPVARQVIQPYRAWSVGKSDWGEDCIYLLQHRLCEYGKVSMSQDEFEHANTTYIGMRGRDVRWEKGNFRNAGVTRKGRVRVYDFGCGDYEALSANIEDGMLVGDTFMLNLHLDDRRVVEGASPPRW